jgi:hypothetical protein
MGYNPVASARNLPAKADYVYTPGPCNDRCVIEGAALRTSTENLNKFWKRRPYERHFAHQSRIT